MRRVTATAIAVIVTAMMLASAFVVAAHPGPAVARPARARLAARPTPIVLILMENKSVNQVAHAGSYLATFASRGRRFTNYFSTSHPSLPNYLDMTSGTASGCTSDACPRQSYAANNIFHQLDLTHGGRAGWRSYAESMPRACGLTNTSLYAMKHNPALYYRDLVRTCPRQDVPLPRRIPSLAPFTFVTPNLCNDMHDCSVATGDRWLRNHVPSFLALGARVIVIFDEGSSVSHVFAAEVGPGIPRGAVDRSRFNHFSLLAGLERHFGLPRLAAVRRAKPMPL